MSDDVTDFEVANAMQMFGGAFVSRLGQLWAYGDETNRARLKAAFPEYWAVYTHMALSRRCSQDGQVESDSQIR